MKHVVVIGAGIIGAACAYFLGRSGCRVTVIDASAAGGIASRASFGWLNASFHLNEAHFHLRCAGMAAHRRLAEVVPGFHQWPGCLWFEDQGQAATDFSGKLMALGYAARPVAPSELGHRWPRMAGVSEAVFLDEEGVIDTPGLALALLRASGAEVWTGVAVQGFLETAAGIAGVRTSAGSLQADETVLVAGVGSAGLLQEIGLALPMLSRPGAMVVTRPVAALTDTLLCGPMGEVRQLADGRILMPTSPNHQGDASDTLAAGPGRLAQQALERLAAVFPNSGFEAETVMVADRPVPGDGLPVLDRALPGLTLAVMHSGATLAALAGEAIAALITTGQTADLWRTYGLARFQK